MIMKISNKLLVILFLACAISLVAVFGLVNPQDKQIIYIFLPVILIWGLIYSTLMLIIHNVLKITSKLGEIIVFVVSGFVVMLLLLSGIGQLTTGDIVLTTFLATVSTFYFYRSWS